MEGTSARQPSLFWETHNLHIRSRGHQDSSSDTLKAPRICDQLKKFGVNEEVRIISYHFLQLLIPVMQRVDTENKRDECTFMSVLDTVTHKISVQSRSSKTEKKRPAQNERRVGHRVITSIVGLTHFQVIHQGLRPQIRPPAGENFHEFAG